MDQRYCSVVVCDLTFVIPSKLRWRGYSNAAVRGWLGEWVSGFVRECVRACVSGSVTFYLVDTIATTVFAQSLSNFTCTFAMMRGGTLLILGHGVTGQGQFLHSVYKTLWAPWRPCGHDSYYSFCPITFKLHMHIRNDERMNPIDFGSQSQKSRSTLALCT